MNGVFDENIHPCKGCEDFEPPDGCKSKGGCSIPSDVYYASIPEACRYCSNHPNNGGSGICHCTSGIITYW